MKTMSEMDLQEWELLPDEGYLEIQDDDRGNKIYSREYPPTKAKGSPTNSTVFQMNYFDIRPAKRSSSSSSIPHPKQFVDKPNRVVTVPIVLEPAVISPRPEEDEQQLVVKKEVGADDHKSQMNETQLAEKAFQLASFNQEGADDGDQDPVSQVFFKKMKEAEFADMKVESPKSNNASGGGGCWGFAQPQIEGFHFEEEEEEEEEVGDPDTAVTIKRKKKVEFQEVEGSDDDDDEEGAAGLNNIWKWSLNGIGAICSFGMAAATVCVIIFSSSQRKNIHNHHHKLQFQISTTSNKRRKHVAEQQSAAIAAARGVAVGGVPITRALITVGGYYDHPTL